ncbi:hypothetical protein B0H16DRAFT_1899044 [Mycena metata]|uniref:Uncharacterized protein n=1 Tax=Mycena metata TaxID=1033252 RepID=A0AAD7MFM9_9AGAR|nr:hypothetical protein B0H16DRAFT_1899044 [Mycena metata]
MRAPHLPRPFVVLLFTLFAIRSSLATLTNVTIDDTDLSHFTWTQDPDTTQATIPWAAVSPSTPCAYCSAQPQTTDIQNQTWHDGSNNSAGSLTFQGPAVYIYGIDLDNPANITFELDGNPAPFHYYSGSEQFVFRSLFFSATNLPANVNHTVSWLLHATKTNGSTGLFDYAVVTVDGSSSATPSGSASGSRSSNAANLKSSKKSKAGPIAGGVVGGLALIALVALALCLMRRQRRKRTATAAVVEPRPFVEQVAPTNAVSLGDSKTLDVAWNNPSPASNPTSTAPASTAPPTTAATRSTADLSSMPLSASQAGSASQPTVAPTEASARTGPRTEVERALEDRLAFLEAQVGQHLPPPYAGSASE